jgi:phage I-like protein
MKHTALALLFASLALAAKAEVQLLPAGEFKGRDGRPSKELTWKLSDSAGQALAAKLNARHAAIKFNLDYEHQLMLARENGQPAPASGWATQFEWRAGQGLFALDVQWTARAKAMIEAGEYLYISPVITYDQKTGEIDDVINAALVNTPNLEMSPVAQERLSALSAFSQSLSSTQPEESSPMNKLLIALLGLTATATDDDVVNAVKQLQHDATTRHASLTALHGALGVPADADTTKATSAVATLKAQAVTGDDTTKNAMAALQAQVAELSNKEKTREITSLVDAALSAGKLLPAQKDWAINLGKTDVAQLSAYLKDAPAVGKGLGEGQSQGEPQGDGKGTAQLSAEQLAVATSMGLTPEQFAKASA